MGEGYDPPQGSERAHRQFTELSQAAAYLRLCARNAGWKNREQFFGVAARLMEEAAQALGISLATANRRMGTRQGLAVPAA